MRGVTAYKLGVAIDVRGDASASSKLRSVDRSVGSLHKSFGDLGSAKGLGALAGSLTGLVGIATAASAGIGTVITTGFMLAKSASEWGSEIHDASEQTGRSTEMISALKMATDQSGGSLSDLTAGFKIFSKTIGDAARGSDEAKDKLRRLGIDPQEAINDLDGALAKAFKTINDAPPGVKQTNAALDAFGRSGANLIPTIRSFDGDLAGLIKRAKELGVTLSKEDAKAADDFGDMLDTLTLQFKGATFAIAKEFMPEIQKGMQDISTFVKENKQTFKDWGSGIGDFVRGVRAIFDSEAASIIGWVVKITSYVNPFTATIRAALWGLKQLGLASGEVEPDATTFMDPANRMKAGAGAYATVAPGSEYDLAESTGEAEKARKEAERRAKIASDARLELLQTAEREASRVRQEGLDKVRRDYDRGLVDKETYVTQAVALERQYMDAIVESIAKERAEVRGRSDEAVTILAKEGALNERALSAQQEFRNRRQRIIDSASETEIERLKRSNAHALQIGEQMDARELASIADRVEQEHLLATDGEKRRAVIIARGLVRRQKALEDELAAVKGNADEEKRIDRELDTLRQDFADARLEHERRHRDAIQQTQEKERERHKELRAHFAESMQWGIEENARQAQKEREDQRRQQDRSPIGQIGNRLLGMLGSSREEFEEIGAMGIAWKNTIDMGMDSIYQMGQGLGEIVGQWTLMGDQADISLAKMTAAVLANLAAQAATMAVYFAAMGVVSLTPWGALLFGPAAPWFKGALLMGIVAAGAAGLGRLAAGNAGGGASSQSTADQNAAFADPNNSANQFSNGSDRRFVPPSEDSRSSQALDRVARALERFENLKPEQVVTLGAPKAYQAITEANNRGLRRSGKNVNDQGRALNFA
jgi:hypothetical protein